MSMSRISEFVTFLSYKNHSLTEILAHLLRVTFRDFSCESIVLFELNDKNEFLTVETSGTSEASTEELSPSYSLNDNYPISHSIKSGNIIQVTEEERFLKEYPLLTNFPLLMIGKSLFCVPISLSGTPVAAFAIFCKTNSSLLTLDLEFLSAISNIFSLSVYASRDFSSVDRKVELDIPHLVSKDSNDLTARQILISRLISEGRTNHDISELIGYSESTVRQEIMKVFVLTNSTSRRQVGEHYQSGHKDI